MRLSDAFILYLSAGAPFGAAFFIRRKEAHGTAHALALAALAALAWPAAAFLLFRREAPARDEAEANVGIGELAAREVEQTRRALLAALMEVEVLTAAASGRSDEKLRFTMFAARESVVRFAGLARAAVSARRATPPTARDFELFRLAGREGEDLRLAGHCVHRRNMLRLLLHRDRARNETQRALSEVRSTVEAACASPHTSGAMTHQLADALARALSLAIDLFNRVGDPRAAEGVKRLLETECAHPQPTEARPRPDGITRAGRPEGEICTTRPEPTAYADAGRP